MRPGRPHGWPTALTASHSVATLRAEPMRIRVNEGLNVARLNHAHQIPIRERKPGRQDDKPHDSRLTRFECEPGVAEQLRRRSADRRDDVVLISWTTSDPARRPVLATRIVAAKAPPASTFPAMATSLCSNVV
jgi:hypothetical protein